MEINSPRLCAIRVSEPWRCGTGPFGLPFSYPVHDQAMSVLGSETRLCSEKIKLPRANAVIAQPPWVEGARLGYRFLSSDKDGVGSL